MKVKVIAALMMAVVMSLAAFASEQRRMCHESASADENRDSLVIAMNDGVTN